MPRWFPLLLAATLSACGSARYASPGASSDLECAPYARQVSGIALYGDASSWWDAAAGRYPRSDRPHAGFHHAVAHGLTSETPQPSNPPTSRVTTLAPLLRATAAIMRSMVGVDRPACLQPAKMSA